MSEKASVLIREKLNGNIMSRIQSLGENANKTLESTKEALQTREYLYGIVQGDVSLRVGAYV